MDLYVLTTDIKAINLVKCNNSNAWNNHMYALVTSSHQKAYTKAFQEMALFICHFEILKLHNKNQQKEKVNLCNISFQTYPKKELYTEIYIIEWRKKNFTCSLQIASIYINCGDETIISDLWWKVFGNGERNLIYFYHSIT